MSSVFSKNSICFGQHLKELRNMQSLASEELVDKLDIPLSTYRKYEADLFLPSIDKLIRFSKYFGVSCDFMLLWSETVYPRNVRFLSMAQGIDKMGAERVAQIKGSLDALTNSEKQKRSAGIKQDDIQISLTSDTAKNITLLAESKGIMKKDIADCLQVTSSQITHYVNGTATPSYKNLVKLSELFSISIHALLTGEKLSFDFRNEDFGQAILAADHGLSLEQHKILITLMEAVLKK